MEITLLQRSIVILMDKCPLVLKRRYLKLDIHFDINISQVSKTEEIIISRKNKKL